MKILLFIWQLPQNLLGLLLIMGTKKVDGIYYRKLFNSAVSLGNFIILDSAYLTHYYKDSVIKHEQGHQKQSLYLGPFYLLAVGIVSFLRNIWDRVAHKKWTYQDRYNWYYGGYPEKWANKLGEK